MRALLVVLVSLSLLLSACGTQVTARGQVRTGVSVGQGL